MVAFAVAEGGGRASGVAEGPVQASAEFGGVGHQVHAVREIGFDEFEFDGADPAVVHVGGGDAVRAGVRVGHGDVRDAFDRHGIVEAAVRVQNAAVAVGGVFAETDVGDDEEGGEGGAQECDGADDGARGVVGRRAQGIFGVGGERDAEEND